MNESRGHENRESNDVGDARTGNRSGGRGRENRESNQRREPEEREICEDMESVNGKYELKLTRSMGIQVNSPGYPLWFWKTLNYEGKVLDS